MASTRSHWFARGGGIAKIGPFKSHEEAARSLITTKGLPVDGAFVWPEPVTKKKHHGDPREVKT